MDSNVPLRRPGCNQSPVSPPGRCSSCELESLDDSMVFSHLTAYTFVWWVPPRSRSTVPRGESRVERSLRSLLFPAPECAVRQCSSAERSLFFPAPATSSAGGLRSLKLHLLCRPVATLKWPLTAARQPAYLAVAALPTAFPREHQRTQK